MSDAYYGQSTQENWKADIEESRKQKTIYKMYEYFDDVSYVESGKAGLLVTENELYLFQKDGPNDKDTLRKLIEWRRSGDSDEIGHKGGGNLRNIYGFESKKTTIYMKTNQGVMQCITKPNEIYDFSKKEIPEAVFRARVDTSEFVQVPEIIVNEEDLPQSYHNRRKQIYDEFEIEPNYLIRMELTALPPEFSTKEGWIEFKHQLGAKQYGFPILVQNEILGETSHSKINTLDLVGFESKEGEVRINLHICPQTLNFYLEHGGQFKDMKGQITARANLLLPWGCITMFIADKEYISKQLKDYNHGIIENNTLKAADVYGVFFKINDKLTNYTSWSDSLPQGKNNKIISWEKSSNYFRMIITPNKKTCQDTKLFDALINTNTIKALTGFLHNSPHKEIIRNSLDIYRGVKPQKTKTKTKSPKEKPVGKQHIGGYYLGYIGKGLWKHGIVEKMDNFEDRINEHRRESIDRVREFLSGETLANMNFTLYIQIPDILNPALFEQQAITLLAKYNGQQIKVYEAQCGSKDREYFSCEDHDFITQTLEPELDKLAYSHKLIPSQ